MRNELMALLIPIRYSKNSDIKSGDFPLRENKEEYFQKKYSKIGVVV